MPKTFACWLLLTSMVLVATVEAQRPRRGRGRDFFGGRGAPSDTAFLVAIPDVQEELGLTSHQRELLESLQSDLVDQRRGLFRGRSGGPPGTRRSDAASEEMQQRLQTLTRQGEKLVMAVLEPEQAERLRQLRLQQEGTSALERDELAESLGLSKSQREMIRAIRASNDPSSANETDARDLSGSERQERQESVDTQIAAVLTDQQKQNWEKMKGKKFDFPDWMARFGQRGFRGPPGSERGSRSPRP